MALARMRIIWLALCGASMTAAAVHADDARKVPLTETVHGIVLQDEYRWMEDPANKDEMVKWVEAEGEATRAKLDAMPERAEFLKLIEQTSSELMRATGYQRAGNVEVYQRATAKDSVPKLFARIGGKEKLLLDPQAGGDKLATVNNYQLSADGKLIGVNVGSGGAELTSIQIYDVATGAKVGGPIDRIWGEFELSFLPGNKIAYTQISESPPGGDPMQGMTAYVRDIDGGTPVAVLGGDIGGAALEAKEFPLLYVPEASPFVVAIAGGARADSPAWVAPAAAVAAGKPEWKSVATLDDKVQGLGLRGNDLFTSSTKTNSAGELIVRTLSADGTPGPATVVFSGKPDLIITNGAVASDGVYVSAQTDGITRLFYSKDGRRDFTEIKMPFDGDMFALGTDRTGKGISFGLSGWLTNNRFYTVRNGKIADTGIAGENWSGVGDYTSEQFEAVSADGTKVPLAVVRSRKAIPAGGVPTLVEAYGGYGINTATPYYFRDGMSWLAKGGALAFCGVRGGGERGRDWHEGGRGPNKPKGQQDLIACAETLTAKGIAPKRGPVSFGASMAGTLVPGAALRKPEVFGGMITAVGIVNATRIGAAENGANQFAEMGDPADPQQFRDLLAMDAYQQLLSAKGIPESLMIIGLNDNRVAPWMSAKFVARAHGRFPGRVFLRSEKDAGHGIGTAEAVRRGQTADMLAFAWNQETKQ